LPRPPPRPPPFPYTTLFRSLRAERRGDALPLRLEDDDQPRGAPSPAGHRRRPPRGRQDRPAAAARRPVQLPPLVGLGVAHQGPEDRKSTRLNSSHVKISYAV